MLFVSITISDGYVREYSDDSSSDDELFAELHSHCYPPGYFENYANYGKVVLTLK